MSYDHAVLAVDSDAGEIADVLSRARQLVEQGRLSRVLVAYQSEGQDRIIRQRIAASLRVELAAFTESGVLAVFVFLFAFFFLLCFIDRDDLYFVSVVHAQCQ